MSVVIIGGHDRMVGQYKKICRQFNCKGIYTDVSFHGKTDRKPGFGRALHEYGLPQDGKMRR